VINAHGGVQTREEPIHEDTNLTPSNHHRTPTAEINKKKYKKIRKNIPVKRIHDPNHKKEDKKHTSKKGEGGSHIHTWIQRHPMKETWKTLHPDPIPRKTPVHSEKNPGQFQAPYNTQPYRGEGGGHASESENIAPQRKEPENAPDTTPFIPKGALMQYKKHYPLPAVQKPLWPATDARKNKHNYHSNQPPRKTL